MWLSLWHEVFRSLCFSCRWSIRRTLRRAKVEGSASCPTLRRCKDSEGLRSRSATYEHTHDTHQATVCRSVYESVCVYVWGCTLVGEHSLLHAHTQTQNVYIIKPCSVLTSAVWRGASSTTISVSDHDFYLLNVGKVGYIMNVSERQQKKKKKGFWERTEAKGSVKGQRRRTIIHE